MVVGMQLSHGKMLSFVFHMPFSGCGFGLGEMILFIQIIQ
jgi:hypothetical protein